MGSELWPVLLSGGSGSRLWPVSRADVPKQLHAIAYDETMLQATAQRVRTGSAGLGFAPPIVVCGEAHRFIVDEQLRQIGTSPSAVILEPEGRNTAAAIGLAAHWLTRGGHADALMLVMPTDHMVTDVAAFHRAVAAAAPTARAGGLVTFGVRPTEPATGYGYLCPGTGNSDAVPVIRFLEKPDADTAADLVAEGYLWNSGIFLFRADVLLSALAAHAPEVATAIDAAMTESTADGLFVLPNAPRFVAAPSISIDYAVMERSGSVFVVPVDMGWSDVGSWDALWRVAEPDSEGNVLRGEGALIACRDSLVQNDGGPFVAALGLTEMVVVSTADAVLIAPRARAEDIRRVVEAIEARGLDLARTSHEVRRPWGSFRVFGHGEGWQVKRISVRPGGRLSLQRHAHRAETWVVASGEAIVTVGDRVTRLGCGESAHIPVGAVHRLENPGPEPLEIIEVQLGAILAETDIERISDIYGRTG